MRALEADNVEKSLKKRFFMDRLFWRAARAHFWCTPMNFSESGDVFWLLDRIYSSKIGENRFGWILVIFENFQYFEKKKWILPWKMQFSCNFNIFYFHQYLSYKYDQVVKRHLFDHTNRSARIICARRESSTMSGKYVFFSFIAHIGARAARQKILYLNSAHQNEQKKP